MYRQPKQLDVDGCAALLGISREQIRHAIEKGDFAGADGSDASGQPYWDQAHVYWWAAKSMPSLGDRIPVDYWPTPATPAAYIEARPAGDSATALGWEAPLGIVWLVWRHAGGVVFPTVDDTLAMATRALRGAAAIIGVAGDFGPLGPVLWAVRPGAPDLGEYEIVWPELSRILGQPVPYWPYALCIPGVIRAWRPGNSTAAAAAVPDLDPSPVLRLAAIVAEGSPAQRTLFNLAQSWQSRATTSAQQDLENVNRTARPGTLVIAATPVEVPAISQMDLEESVRRAGWLDVLSRYDDLAAACVRQRMLWGRGEDFPFSNPEIVDPDTPHGQEWARRLVPVPRTAAVEILDPHQSAVAAFVDPETDAVVISDSDGRLHAAIPQRLPAASPLAEMILRDPIWVRTQDGTLYPAPKDHYFGLSWGYSGTGPGTLAVLADQLLGDINAVAADTATGAPSGLEQLMQRDWPEGTILTRAQLEAARAIRP